MRHGLRSAGWLGRLAVAGHDARRAGDVLLSDKAKPGLDIQVPTIAWGHPTNRDIITDGSGPAGLVQKVAICDDNLVIGWAGKERTAREIISELYSRNKQSPFDGPGLIEFLDGLPLSARSEVGIVGYHRTPDIMNVFNWGSDVTKIPTSRFNEVALVGTGKRHFMRYKDQLKLDSTEIVEGGQFLESLEGANVVGEIPASSVIRAISTTLMLIGKLLGEEINTADSLKNFFGAAYEIAMLIENGFKKLDDITYLFWVARLEGDGVRIDNWPIKGFRYAYQSDILLVRTLEVDHAIQNVSGTVFRIGPIYRDLSEDEATEQSVPSFDSRYLVNYLYILEDQKLVDVLIAVHFQTTDEKWITFEETEGRFRLIGIERLQSEFCNHLLNRRSRLGTR